MVETLAIVTICNATLSSSDAPKQSETFEIFQGQGQAPFSQLSHGFWSSGSTPTRFWIQMVFYGVRLFDVVMFLKGMAIHLQLVETPKFSAWCSHLEPLVPGPRRSVPNGSTQHFMRWTHWLHLSQRLLSTFCKETTSVLLPSDCLFLVGSLSPQEGQSWTLQSLKTSLQAKASRKYPRRHPYNGGWKLTGITPEPKASWKWLS